MTTYRHKRTPQRIYRKIYEQHYGPIPVEPDGRSYEIHHIDGDDTNNDPLNLTAVTLQEHYDIHYAQGDLYACYLMAVQRMAKTPEEISELATERELKRVQNGTHHWLRRPDGTSQQADRMQSDPNYVNPYSIRPDGTSVASDRVENGTHHFLGGAIQTKSNNNRVANGTHPGVVEVICNHCNKVGSKFIMMRWHFENCKHKPK